MNWKKGLFRIWLILSIPYVLIVGYICFNEFYDDSMKRKMWDAQSANELIELINEEFIKNNSNELDLSFLEIKKTAFKFT